MPIAVKTRSQTIALLDACYARNDPTIIAFANAHALNIAAKNERFREVLRRSIVINDGIGVDLASRLLFGSSFPNNLNGTDFIPHYLQNTKHQCRIFLLGGAPETAQRVGQCFSEIYPQHRIVGWHHGYFSDQGTPTIVGAIKAAKADIVLVGIGNPRQEEWLADNLAATGCRLGFAVGALFAFVTGDARRAPAWLRATRLEWLHRLVQEPERLWRRYLIGNPLFIVRIFAQWLGGGE